MPSPCCVRNSVCIVNLELKVNVWPCFVRRPLCGHTVTCWLNLVLCYLQAPHNVVRYELRGTTSDMDYFMVDSISGDISLRTPVYSDQVNLQQDFVVRVACI